MWTYIVDPWFDLLNGVQLFILVRHASRREIEERTCSTVRMFKQDGRLFLAARKQFDCRKALHSLRKVSSAKLTNGRGGQTRLLSTEGPVLVAVNCIEGDERMETKRSFAILWDHCLAMLEYAVSGSIYFQFRALTMRKSTHTAPRRNKRDKNCALLDIRVKHG